MHHHASSASFGDRAKAFGLGLLDVATGIPSMVKDVHTVFGTSAPWYDKAGAGLDFGFNAVSDVLMFTGVGEVLRGAAIGEHVGMDLLEHVGEDALADCGAGLSFIATTVVATQVGEQAIGTLHPGEQVWAYNPTTRKMELQPIVHVWINHDHDLVDLTITRTIKQGKATKPTSEVIHTNKKHPFLTVEKGFLPVGQITLGMHILEANGQTGVVSGWRIVPGVMTMYNLEVALDHTFAVGVGMWVVHNCGNVGEIITNHPDAQSAYDHAMGQIGGPLDDNAVRTQAKGLGGDTTVAGLDNGLKDGSRSWRLDYDPEKGTHFNWMIGKKSGGGSWGAATFPGTHENYENMLLQFTEGGVEDMLG